MSRVKRSVHAKKKRRKVLKEAKGYYGRKHSSYRFAKEQVQRSGMYAYRDRRNRKREMGLDREISKADRKTVTKLLGGNGR